MTELRKIQAKYAKQNLQIIGINLDTDARVAAEFLQSGKSFPWPHVQEQGGFESDLAVGLGVLSVPVTILIDGDGKVAKRTSHFSKAMEDALDELIAKPAPKQATKPQAPSAQPSVRKAQQPAPTRNANATRPR